MSEFEESFDFEALIPKESLHLDFWDDMQLHPEVRSQLLMIAQGAIDKLEIGANISDIVLTGSLASYGWHDHSDFDLHIILDFEEINEDFSTVSKLLNLARINWNRQHDIEIAGHEVEIYYQDINEKHYSLGAFSLLRDKWIQDPSTVEHDLDLRNAEKKAEAIAESILHAEQLFNEKDYEASHEYSEKIFRKIKKMRASGLERDGIYSNENLAFKMLRNAGLIDDLAHNRTKSYDQMMSLEINESRFLEKWAKFTKGVR